MAPCGFPSDVGGTFDDRNLLVCTPAGIVRDPSLHGKAQRIKALVRTEAIRIDRGAKTVTSQDLSTEERHTLGSPLGSDPMRPSRCGRAGVSSASSASARAS